MPGLRAFLTWAALAAALAVPLAVAATSPLLAWRDPVYVAAGLAGVAAMGLMLLQPLLAGGLLPGLPSRRGRRVHRWTGAALIALLATHVAGLWVTSPPDVVDALLFRSPTPFSDWGVVAFWAAVAAAIVAARRRRLRPPVWRLAHAGLALTAVGGGVVHAMLVEGTMGAVSKAVLCVLVLAAALAVVLRQRPRALLAEALRRPKRRRGRPANTSDAP